MPDDWSWRNKGPMSGVANSNVGGAWVSDGNYALKLFTLVLRTHSAGDYIKYYQSVDMSGFDELMFDAFLEGGMYSNSYIAIDSQKLWVSNQGGTYSRGILERIKGC